MELKDIIKPPVVIAEDCDLEEALKAMFNSQTNSLLVVNEAGELVGEVAVADLLDAVVPADMDGDAVMKELSHEEIFAESVRNARNKPLKDFMSMDFVSIREDDDLLAVASSAITRKRARIPVVDKGNHPIGIISRRGIKSLLAKYLGIEEK